MRGKYKGNEWRQCREEMKEGKLGEQGKGETAAVCASVAESWNCLLAQRVHMSLVEEGRRVRGGRGEH